MSTTSKAPFVGERLASFVVATGWDHLAPALRHEAKRSLLNFMAGALAVPADPAVEAAVRVLGAVSGPGRATLIGRRERMDTLSASFVNAVAANLLDYDDTHLDTVIHPSAPVAPPVLALAEARSLSGRDVLLAFALGAEVECRIGVSVSPGHYARGWHITATCGVFGAAAAAAKLLRLDRRQTWNALGVAASQSAGLVENLPSAAKNVGIGNAARNGLFAALLAQQGYAAAPAAIEGPLGWARATGDEPSMAALTEGLGDRWELARNTYKPYPCGIVMHAVVDACLELRARYPLSAEAVRSVTVRGNDLLIARGDREVHDDRDARVSIHHCAAAALLWGAAGVREFSPECVADPRAVALRAKIRAECEPGCATGAARVLIDTVSGERFEAAVEHARGSLAKPLTDADIEAKARDLARLGRSGCDVDRLIDAVWCLDSARDVHDLMRSAGAAAMTRPSS